MRLVLSFLLLAGAGAAAPAPGEPQKPEKAAPAAEIDLSKLARKPGAAPGRDPFGPRSFAEPAVPKSLAKAPRAAPPKPAPAPKPSAPPLPFAYLGKVTQGAKTEVYVVRGEELISIAPGQNIDAQYRVEAVSDTAIRFTYLPLKTEQTLTLPEAGA